MSSKSALVLRSGTVSFNEWVTALVALRKQMLAAEKQEAAVEQEAAMKAADAFDEADFGFEGELTFQVTQRSCSQLLFRE